MWTEPRKSYRSPQTTTAPPPRLSTTCVLTPAKGQNNAGNNNNRQCPLHFNQCSHVCLTCRKSICLRCAITYCQQHVIRPQNEAMQQLRQQIYRLQLKPRAQQLQSKLQQSSQRQDYLQKKVLRLIQSIQSHFDYIMQVLVKKKLQIIQHYDQKFQTYLQQHRDYDIDLKQRLKWLQQYSPTQLQKVTTIQQLDRLTNQLKKSGNTDAKMQKKVTKMLMGKGKIRVDKLWTQEHLEKVLYQIQHVEFGGDKEGRTDKRKKRMTTQNAAEQFNQTISFAKSSSNSRFPSGRKHTQT